MINVEKVMENLKNRLNAKRLSAWNKGVILTAIDIVEYAEEGFKEAYDWNSGFEALLNGADTIQQYTEGGLPLVYDRDICARFSTPSEIRRTKNGWLRPNARESWLDVMERGNFQAFMLVLQAVFNKGGVNPEYLV